ncbi:MAG: sulfide-dependent adenosine diphosphate thiazole synthase [candidate division WOR-3 bacterium]
MRKNIPKASSTTGWDEIEVTRAIFRAYSDKFMDSLRLDVAIVGAGPSGMVASYYLALEGFRVAVFERKLAPGGGMWGGGMMFNEIVVQKEALPIMDEFGVRYSHVDNGLYVADSVHTMAMLLAGATSRGVRIFNCVSVEDIMARDKRIAGIVIQWTPVDWAKMHVDPLTIAARVVIDATGHEAEVTRMVQDKLKAKLNTPTGRIMDERPMWAERAEEEVVANTREVYPGLWVMGMAANAVYGSARMGPIFGGMLLSGRRAAEDVAKYLRERGN